MCASLAAKSIEISGEADHVHLLVKYPPTLQLSRLVGLLKGSSSRRLREERLPGVASKLWGGHLWSPSYFAASSEGAPIAVVRQYIESQRRALTQPKSWVCGAQEDQSSCAGYSVMPLAGGLTTLKRFR